MWGTFWTSRQFTTGLTQRDTHIQTVGKLEPSIDLACVGGSGGRRAELTQAQGEDASSASVNHLSVMRRFPTLLTAFTTT